jgi:hypothetical protein
VKENGPERSERYKGSLATGKLFFQLPPEPHFLFRT